VRPRTAIVLGACLPVALSAYAQQPAAPDDVRLKGTRMSAAESAESVPVILIGKRGVMAALTSGVDAYCAEQTVSVDHRRDDGYRLDEASHDLAGLLGAIGDQAGTLRCLRIVGDRPDRSDVDRLEAELVEAKGMTILLPPGD
jgi:hypothetical protein